MAVEVYIIFEDKKWYYINKERIEEKIYSLRTFLYSNNGEFWLQDAEYKNTWPFNVRIFLKDEYIVVEINSHSPNIEISVEDFFDWFKKQTTVKIQNEDGEPW